MAASGINAISWHVSASSPASDAAVVVEPPQAAMSAALNRTATRESTEEC
jgi:hypothetical protein